MTKPPIQQVVREVNQSQARADSLRRNAKARRRQHRLDLLAKIIVCIFIAIAFVVIFYFFTHTIPLITSENGV